METTNSDSVCCRVPVAAIVPMPAVVLVSCYSACEIAWHPWERTLVAACAVVPVAAIVPVSRYSADRPL